MKSDELTKLVDELNGKVDLRMREDALSLCRQILDEAEAIDAETFSLLCNSIGMFTDDFSPWMDDLSARFEAQSKRGKAETLPVWILVMCAANVKWEQIKPYVALDKLPDEIIPRVCFCAIDANDITWCEKALKTLEKINEKSGYLFVHGIAQAALQSITRNYLAALVTLSMAKHESEFFEDYFAILTKATIGHYLQSLDHLGTHIEDADKLPDPDTELLLPGNDRERFEDLRQAISQAAEAATKLAKDLVN